MLRNVLTDLANTLRDQGQIDDKLDEELKKEGVEMIAPHRSNRLERNKLQDGRRLRRYQRRWLVECFLRLQWHRRLLVRWEFYSADFLGFVQLASVVILLKRF